MQGDSTPRTRSTRAARESLVSLTADLRMALTPVIGYAETLAYEDVLMAKEQQLRWVAMIERNLEVLQELGGRTAEVCARLREELSE